MCGGIVSIGLCIVLAAQPVAAQSAPQTPASSDLERAKELFRKGNELRRAGQCDRALELFVRSRELVPSAPNILNAAFCLNVLGRFDESLEHYELLLTDFKTELSPQEIELISSSMGILRDKVGSLDVTANVTDATLVVDGRARGRLPLVAPVRVLPGTREVTIVKNGYQSFRAEIEIAPARTERLRAELMPLRIAGRLRVDAAALAGSELVVDGAPLGKVPWEGVLAPGEHWIAVSSGELGSAPTRIVVVEGQTVLGAPRLEALGPRLVIAVEPANADLVLGDVAVGKGRWQGRLPRRKHRVTARAEGYTSESRVLEVTAAGPRRFTLDLAIDPDHPRWARDRGAFFAEALGGIGVGTGLGTGAERACGGDAECSENPLPVGFVLAARAGYELPNRVSIFGVVGFFRFAKDVERRHIGTTGSGPATFELRDRLRFSGPFAGAGLGYRFGSEPLELRTSLAAGAILVSADDEVDGRASADGDSATVSVLGSGSSTRGANVLLMPDISVGVRLGALRFGVGLMAPLFLLDGPDNDHGETVIDEPGRCAADAIVFCSPFQTFTEQEPAWGRFAALLPYLTVGAVF